MSGSRATPGRSRLAEVLTIGAVGVDQQHRDGHGTDAAGDGGQRLRDRLDAGLVDVARELAGFGVAGDADVDDDRTGLDVLTRDQAALAGGGDQDVGRPGDGREVEGVRVRDRDGRMVLEGEESEWAPDQ